MKQLKENVLLINGCSHAAGYEIDGNDISLDSANNRQLSFGNKLAVFLQLRPINIATGASTNSAIMRSTIEWIEENYKSDEMKLTVLLAWTEPSRLEAPILIKSGATHDEYADWKTKSHKNFLRINVGAKTKSPFNNVILDGVHSQQEMYEIYQEFQIHADDFNKIETLNKVLMMQYYLSNKKIDYIFCDGSSTPYFDRDYFDFYVKNIDAKYYHNFLSYENAFWQKYTRLGYKNETAKYFHHSAKAHQVYALELYEFYQKIYGTNT